ncbi:GNAT family N-acetyltransferase [Thalassobacillus pellis]|uniref:GNAT family N-acetyltransferase n=1 Tax=Thalassobacillus pellis TaxID=748008 RepID=UPI0019622269|nr:GNAT family N-acetyltransferase [Thalassobacillus pellis]MBM7554318.1 ElaA protein [Thalassobacillus pellis]
MVWKQKHFHELDRKELYKILQIRVNIFVVEQNCPYPELDGYDEDAIHLWMEEGDDIAAYCRLVPGGTKYELPSIGRVLVHKEYRGNGYARTLMEKALAVLEEQWKEKGIFLQGQEHLRGFYQSCGFQPVSDVYLDDGIPHVDMIKKSDTQ